MRGGVVAVKAESASWKEAAEASTQGIAATKDVELSRTSAANAVIPGIVQSSDLCVRVASTCAEQLMGRTTEMVEIGR